MNWRKLGALMAALGVVMIIFAPVPFLYDELGNPEGRHDVECFLGSVRGCIEGDKIRAGLAFWQNAGMFTGIAGLFTLIFGMIVRSSAKA